MPAPSPPPAAAPMPGGTSPACPPRLVIVGCGYVGKRLAKALKDRCDVFGLVSSATSLNEIEARGIRGAIIDLDAPTSGRPYPWTADAAVVYLVPPPAEGDGDPRLVRFLDRLGGQPRVFVYASTTGVYGDTGGNRVSEQTPVRPRTARARRRVAAEEAVRTWCTENRVRRVVLRVPGIYGPGRLPLDRLASGEPAVRLEDSGPGNRIHVDDLVGACIAAVDNADAMGVYNVTDGSPVSPTGFLLRVARLAGLPEPPQISLVEAQLVLSPSRLSFLNESRDVGNERLVGELGVTLRYADVDDGIRQSLEEAAGLQAGRTP